MLRECLLWLALVGALMTLGWLVNEVIEAATEDS